MLHRLWSLSLLSQDDDYGLLCVCYLHHIIPFQFMYMTILPGGKVRCDCGRTCAPARARPSSFNLVRVWAFSADAYLHKQARPRPRIHRIMLASYRRMCTGHADAITKEPAAMSMTTSLGQICVKRSRRWRRPPDRRRHRSHRRHRRRRERKAITTRSSHHPSNATASAAAADLVLDLRAEMPRGFAGFSYAADCSNRNKDIRPTDRMHLLG